MQQIFKRFSILPQLVSLPPCRVQYLPPPNCHTHGNGIRFLWSFSSGSITSSSICLHDHWFGKLYILLVTTGFIDILLSRIYFSDRGGNCKRSVHVAENIQFSVGFYYYIKGKRPVCIEILNLGLKRNLRNTRVNMS